MNRIVTCLVDGSFVVVEFLKKFTPKYMEPLKKYNNKKLRNHYNWNFSIKNDIFAGKWNFVFCYKFHFRSKKRIVLRLYSPQY